MKMTVGNFFEPLLFLVFLMAAGIMSLSSTRRRRYRLMCSQSHTGCGFLKLLRYTSKKAVKDMPLFLPAVLLIGGLPGLLLNGLVGSMAGIGIALLFLALLPVTAPLPSVVAELDGGMPNRSANGNSPGSPSA